MNCQINIPLIEYIQRGYDAVMIKLTLEKALENAKITRYELSKRTDIQYQIIDNYYKNHVKRYDSFILDRICAALDCGIDDIIEYTK